MTKTEQAQYDAAVARKIQNARYAAALVLADVAEATCRTVGTSAESLAAMPDRGWMKLARLAGRTP